MKQFLPTKSAEHEETPVRYSSSEISRLRPREVPAVLQTESAGTFFVVLWAMQYIENARNLATFNTFLVALGRR